MEHARNITRSHQRSLIGFRAGKSPSLANEPHVGSGGAIPTPRKLRNDSCKIAFGTTSVA